MPSVIRKSTVYLVGAGPGDPGLMTVRGRDILTQADAVVYDRLANPVFLALARPDAELVDVGKVVGAHSLTQEQINATLIELAARGLSVCRLKGGDPFVFGRGGEEALALLAHGLAFEVVPGVTSAIAAAAYAGVPVTHRNVATSFAVVTGHENPDKPESQVDWQGIATGADTLVFLMGIGNLPLIASKLIAHGRPADTPVAVIHRGTWPCQRCVEGTLEDIADKVKAAGLKPPSITVVGAVAELRGSLSWFESKPLFGRKVVVTRSRTQASELCELLIDAGAEPVELPVIAIAARDCEAQVSQLVADGLPFDWTVFTSTNAVELFFAALHAAGGDSRLFGGKRLGAVGQATADALRGQGLHADFIPTSFSAADFVAEFPDAAGHRVLFPCAASAGDLLARELSARGATVETLPLYDTLPDLADSDRVRAQFAAGELDAVTFTSSSTVRNFRQLLPDLDLSAVCLAAIGPRTAETMRELGLEPAVIAGESRLAALVEALGKWFALR